MIQTPTPLLIIGTVVHITGVVAYDGLTGRIIGATCMAPSWPVVQLDAGRRVVVHPGQLSDQITGVTPSCPSCAPETDA